MIKTHKTKSQKAGRHLIYGLPKVGKSTFASCASGALFLACEHGLDNIDAEATDLMTNYDMVLEILDQLIHEDHGFKTLVIDTMSALEVLMMRHTAKSFSKKSYEEIEYGRGKGALVNRVVHLLAQLDRIHNRGIMIIMIAHSDIVNFKDPMGEAYDTYKPQLHKHISPIIEKWADIIGFAKQEHMLRESQDGMAKRKTAIAQPNRRLYLDNTASCLAGSRYDLPASIDLVFADYIKHFKLAQA